MDVWVAVKVGDQVGVEVTEDVGVSVEVRVLVVVGVVVLVRVAVWVCVLVGVGEVQAGSEVISMALRQALFTDAVPTISIKPVVTVTAALLSYATFSPTAAKRSTLLITVTPLAVTLKTLLPEEVK